MPTETEVSSAGDAVRSGGGRRRRRVIWGAVALVVIWSGLVLVGLAQAASDLRKASDTVRRARDDSQISDLVDGRPLPAFRQARSEFARAHDRLSGLRFLPLRFLPVLGRQLRSVTTLSSSAEQILDIGIDAVDEARRLLELDRGGAAQRPGLVRSLGDVATRTDRRLARVRFGPRQGLLPRLAEARNELTENYSEVRTGLRRGAIGAAGIADLLAGPRRYLLFAANNGEMRAGSGMFLSVGELVTDSSGVRLVGMRSVTEIPVPPNVVPLEGDLADRWAWLEPNNEWRNLMLSPRFEASAELAARMWVALGNQPVDGVLAVDPVALQGLLAGTGPVNVEGRQVDEGNVVGELLHEQYQRYPTLEEKPERREALGQIAAAVFAALDERRTSAGKLIGGLSRAVRGRHLMLWSERGSEEAAWQALGADGSLRADSLLVSVLNRGGNKLDQFLQVSADVSVKRAGDDQDVTLRLHLRNAVPENENSYISGPHTGSGVGEGVYLGIVAVNLPAAAADARFEGVGQLAVAGSDGPSRVVGFQTDLARGEERTVTARFRLPGKVGSVHVEPSARVPPIRWSAGADHWTDDHARTVFLRPA